MFNQDQSAGGVDDSCFSDLIATVLQKITANNSERAQVPASKILMISIGVIAIIANVSSLLAVTQVKRTTYSRLITSLSVSNILVGLCVLMSVGDIHSIVTEGDMCLFISWRALRMTSHLISLLNLLGLGLDHYFAILYPLEYLSQKSVQRIILMICVFWFTSVLCGFSDFFIPAPNYTHCVKKSSGCFNVTDINDFWMMLNVSSDTFYYNESSDYSDYVSNYSDVYNSDSTGGYDFFDFLFGDFPPANDTSYNDDTDSYEVQEFGVIHDAAPKGYCESVFCSKYDSEYLMFVLAVLLLIVMTYLYTRVCLKIYSMSGLRGTNKRTFRKNKRGLITTLFILVTFMLCWLPYCIFSMTTIIKMVVDQDSIIDSFSLAVKLDIYLYNLLLLNSLCDPLIYAFRMREIRAGYWRLGMRCCLRVFSRHDQHPSTCSSSFTASVARKSRPGRSEDMGETRHEITSGIVPEQ